MRAMYSLLAMSALALLAGCAERGEITLDPAAGQVGAVVPIFVGTNRGLDANGLSFTAERAEGLTFARYDISIPPAREVGEIRFARPSATPNPQTDFLTTRTDRFADAPSFQRDLAGALRARPRGQRDAIIFVHGFNNTFAEGLYRLAQMAHDLDLQGVPVHFAWPSRGAALAYVADRDSALYSRDGLESLIHEVEAAGAENIVLVAHSMGSALTMESLRQLAIRGDSASLARISGVILISPDIDVDLFRSQAMAIGTLPQPFLIFGSDRDRILGLSARLTGEPERLGNLSDIERLADLQVTYLDSSAYSQGAGHFNLGDNPALIGLIDRIGDVDAALARDRRGRTGLLPGLVLTVRNATEIILAPVTAISQAGRP